MREVPPGSPFLTPPPIRVPAVPGPVLQCHGGGAETNWTGRGGRDGGSWSLPLFRKDWPPAPLDTARCSEADSPGLAAYRWVTEAQEGSKRHPRGCLVGSSITAAPAVGTDPAQGPHQKPGRRLEGSHPRRLGGQAGRGGRD